MDTWYRGCEASFSVVATLRSKVGSLRGENARCCIGTLALAAFSSSVSLAPYMACMDCHLYDQLSSSACLYIGCSTKQPAFNLCTKWAGSPRDQKPGSFTLYELARSFPYHIPYHIRVQNLSHWSFRLTIQSCIRT